MFVVLLVAFIWAVFAKALFRAPKHSAGKQVAVVHDIWELLVDLFRKFIWIWIGMSFMYASCGIFKDFSCEVRHIDCDAVLISSCVLDEKLQHWSRCPRLVRVATCLRYQSLSV